MGPCILLILFVGLFHTVAATVTRIDCGQGVTTTPVCIESNNLTCRFAQDITNTGSLTEICFPLDELADARAKVGVDIGYCGDNETLVYYSPSNTSTGPEVLPCNTDSDCLESIYTRRCFNGFCCSEDPELHHAGVGERKKRSVHGGGQNKKKDRKERREEKEKKREERKKRRNRKQQENEEEEEAEQLTTTAPEGDEVCEKVVSKGEVRKRFPETISSVTLVRRLGYHGEGDCKKKDYRDAIGKSKVFEVENCFAVFEVCYKPKVVVDTTLPPFTTAPDKVCMVFDNIRGLVKECPGKIVSIEYKASNPVDEKFRKSKKQKRIHGENECVEGEDYYIKRENKFFANANCPGRFKICHVPGEDVEQLTTLAPEQTCRTFVALKNEDKAFDGPIQTFKLIKEFHDLGKCIRDKSYRAEGARFIVNKGCRGVFEICFIKTEQTTPQLTTTAPEQACEKLVNVHGVKTAFPGRVVSAEYIPSKARGYSNPKKPFHGLGCQEEIDYNFLENVFIANFRCVGFFEVCYELPLPTTPQITTAIIEPVCEKIVVHKDGETRVNGKIQTVQLLKQVPALFAFGLTYSCKEEKDFTFEGDTLIVDNGCHGLYKVCYFESLTTPALTTTEKPKKKKKNKGKKKKSH